MKRDVKVIKGDTTLKRTASGCVERSIKRVAAYCRVSTDTEDQINSYNSQVEHYTDFIKQNNEWTLAGIYADEAITGTQVDRRIDFQRLINDCMNGDIDMVITKSISRFARNTLDTLKYVRKLKEYNVAVFFEEENINTLTMDGELLLTILSSVAQQEVENISANVKKGLRMKMERGEMVGFQGCLGYDYDPETKSISVNEKEAEIVRYIFRRYLEGVGGMVISRELEEQGYLSPRGHKRWTETTVLGIIKNEKYKGDLLMGKTFTVDPISKRRLDNFGEQDKFYIENHHEPIISEEDFEKAQGIRLRRAKNRNTVANNGGKREKYSRKYAFSSMLECGFCGHMLSRRNWHSSSEYTKVIWQCVNATKNGKKYCPHSKGIEEEAIEKAFMESYRQVCHNNVEITNEFLKTVEEELKDNSLAKDLKKISNQLDKILKKEKDLVELRLNEAISMEIYQEKYNEIAISKEKLLEEKRTLEVTLTDEKALKKRLEGFKKLLESNKYLEEFDRTVFESIVDKIVIGGTNDDGDIDPAMITIIYKTGKKDSQNGRLFKSRRKNAKVVEENDGDKLYSQSSNEVNKLCSYSTDNTCGVRGIVGEEEKMARYELGAIYKIPAQIPYYARLLAHDVYGIFERTDGEISHETFEKTPYRLYISTGSFAVKRGFWGKMLPSPDKTDSQRWSRPPYLIYFTPWDIKASLDRRNASDQNGYSTLISTEEYLQCLKQGFLSNILPMYENIPAFLDKVYDNWPESYIYSDIECTCGTPEHQKKQIDALKKLGYDVTKYE